MRGPPGEPEKENPESVAAEIGVQGIEALPQRVQRYSKAKNQALEVADSIGGFGAPQRLIDRVKSCGDYLVFRHYFTIDEVRLHGASLCMKHLLCPLCAIRRGAKAMKAYLDRWECIRAEKPLLRPFLVTLTVKDGDDLAERFRHLQSSQRELWKRKQRGRGSVLDGVQGAVWSYEVKRGSGSNKWHPHLHMIALAEHQPDAGQLAAEWHNITGDSFIVDVRPIDGADEVSGFLEVFKYAVKFSEQPPADTWHCFKTLSGKRLLGSSGCFLDVVVPEALLDETADLAGLPFVEMFYRYLDGGYQFQRRQWKPQLADGQVKRERKPGPLREALTPWDGAPGGKFLGPLAAIPPARHVRGSKRSAAPSPH
jgi:hypothetical protein